MSQSFSFIYFTAMKNLHLEKSILSMLMYPDNLILDHKISVEDFTLPLHKKIFKAISEYWTDSALLSGKLKEEEQEDFRAITTYAIWTFWFENNLAELQELTERRRIHNIAHWLKIACKNWLSSEWLREKINSFNQWNEPREADIKETLKEIVMELVGEKEINTFPTGYVDLDRLLHFAPWQLVIIAARPSVWKTLFAMNIMLNQINDWKKCAFFSMEMSNKEMLQRILARNSGLHISDMKGTMDQKRLEVANRAIEEISDKLDKSLILVDNVIHLAELEKNIVRMNRDWVELFYIDYLGLIESNWENRNAEITKATRKLKQLAIQYGITIVLLSQLNRDLEKRADNEPRLSDLRDSGSIEQDADIVLMLARDLEYTPREMTVFIRKNRNWELGEVKLQVLASSMQVGNI